MDLRRELGLTYVFISHNLAVVEHIATPRCRDVSRPRRRDGRRRPPCSRAREHPYTQALLASVLTPEPGLGIPETGLGLAFPDPLNPPPGCPFHPRCPDAIRICPLSMPPLVPTAAGIAACHVHAPAEGSKSRMSRESAIARAERYFDSGDLKRDLARRVGLEPVGP